MSLTYKRTGAKRQGQQQFGSRKRKRRVIDGDRWMRVCIVSTCPQQAIEF
jgi:hypothetical protein